MAENPNRKFEVPWSTLLPLVALFGGIVAQYRPLTSARPPVPLEKSIGVAAIQDVDARLWQDPLAVAEKRRNELEASKSSKGVSVGESDRHSLQALKTRIEDLSAKEKVLVLAVMLNSGPYAEQGELRLRGREAVLEGLSESYFVPVDGEHIGFVTLEWPPFPPGSSSSSSDGTLLIPWEECTRVSPVGETGKAKWNHAVVMWLPASNFNSTPLHFLGWLIQQIRTDRADIKVIGPPTSNNLQAMIEEARSSNVCELSDLENVEILSAKATAPASQLLDKDDATEQQVREKIESYKDGTLTGIKFIRTIATDDILRDAMIRELGLRGVLFPGAKDVTIPDRVAVLSEWDSKYGRSWGEMFTKDPRVELYHYLHGIDGRLPGDQGKPEQANANAKTATVGAATVEVTEGQDQSDFIRRLAHELKNLDIRTYRGPDRRRIRAIGLLGTDVFDKLMILRALRPEFPDAVFFTNNYDAHLELRDAWNDTHNLVIVSPFGSVLSQHQKKLAPFRDSDQTATFVATLLATEELSEAELNQLISKPYLFEVGRNGVQQLEVHPSDGGEVLAMGSELNWFSSWWAQSNVRKSFALTGLFLLLLAFWINELMIRDRKKDDFWERLTRALSSEILLVAGIPLIILSVSYLSQRSDAIQEPLAFFSGISVWPSEMLRLIALLLAFHFMLKAHVAMRDNENEINKSFELTPLSLEERKKRRFAWSIAALCRRHPEWFEEGKVFAAEEMWHAYLRFNKPAPRFIRVGTYFSIYLLFCVSLFMMFGFPVVPARGPFAFSFDRWVIWAAALAMMLLTFYIVDAIQLNRNFIRIFTRGISSWPPKGFERAGRLPPLTEEQLAPYHNILFVAKRTEVVARLVWYPWIVLTLMLLARISLFDNWTWPPAIILIFGLNASWALGSAILLRRAAEKLRLAAIDSLERFRSQSYADETKRGMLSELIDEIRGLKKGAFAPLHEQPFIQAILVPSGSVGALAIVQRLFELF